MTTAPSVAAVGTYNAGTTVNRTPGVPSGVVSGSFVLIIQDTLASVDPTDPSGFTLGFNDAATYSRYDYWKFATGSDSGTYTVATGSGVNPSDSVALRVIDVHPTAPYFGTQSLPAGSASSTTIQDVGPISNVPADSLLVWVVTGASGASCTPPTGFTRQTADVSQRMHVATKVHNPGGTGTSSTGTVNGATWSAARQHRATLVALVPAIDATVSAVAATASGAALAPAVTAVRNATVAAVVATATALAPAPAVHSDANVTAVVATATSTAVAPTVTVSATVNPPAATATATAPAPVVTAQGDGLVQAVTATGTATALPPTVTGTQNATVTAVTATASSAALVPAVTGSTVVSPPAAQAGAAAIAPVSVTGQQNVTITAPVATATATALAPMVFIETGAPRKPRATIRDNDAEAVIKANYARAVID